MVDMNEIYTEAFNDELEKIGGEEGKAFMKEWKSADKQYKKDIKPYSRQRKVVGASAAAGGIAGLVGGARLALKKVKGPYRAAAAILAGYGGGAAGSLAATSASHHTLGYVDPKYKNTYNKAVKSQSKSIEKAHKKIYGK